MMDKLNIPELMQKAQELQESMKKQAEEAAAIKHVVTVGGDMVQLTINGKQEILGIKIDPEVVDAEDVETLQDLMCSAFNQAIQKTRAGSMDQIGKALGNFQFPGFPKP